MNKWLVIHPHDDYAKYPMIGVRLKPKKFWRFWELPQPTSEEFGKIKNGDLIAYYSFFDHALVGLFKVVSDIRPWAGGGDWSSPGMVCNIEPFKLPCDGKCYFDLKQFSGDNADFDKLCKGSFEFYNEEKRCVKLSDTEFQELEEALSNPKYIKLKDEKMGVPNIELVGALLDFYNSRATSFVSMFVASIFGIVTLSAIVENWGSNPLLFGSSLFPYFAFVAAAYYTLRRYFFYADIAEKLQYNGLQTPNKLELKKVRVIVEDEYKMDETDFSGFLRNKKVMWEKRQLNKSGSHAFEGLYIIVIFFLTIIVYRTFLQDIFAFLGFVVSVLIAIIVVLTLFGVGVYKNRKDKIKNAEPKTF